MYYEKFQELCEKNNVRPSTVSKATGISTATFTSWKQGKYTPKQDKLQKIADYFEVPLSEITGPRTRTVQEVMNDVLPRNKKSPYHEMVDTFVGNMPMRISRQIPVLGRVAAGAPIEAMEDLVDYEEISGDMARSNTEYFGLKIKGDSMEPSICNEDTVIVRQQEDAEDGDTVIALINGNDAVCKRYRRYKDGIALVSINPLYEPMYFTAEEIDNTPVKVIGKVVELRRRF